MGGWYEGCPWHCPGLPATAVGLLTPGWAWLQGRGCQRKLRNEGDGVQRLEKGKYTQAPRTSLIFGGLNFSISD